MAGNDGMVGPIFPAIGQLSILSGDEEGLIVLLLWILRSSYQLL